MPKIKPLLLRCAIPILAAGLLSGWFIPLMFHKQPTSKPVDKTEFVEPATRTFTPYEIYLMSRK